MLGCGSGSAQGMLNKAESARAPAELERALGKPDQFESVGIGPLAVESYLESYGAVATHHADSRAKFHGIIDRLDAARCYAFDRAAGAQTRG